jgi:hypothetical protein
VSWWGWLVLLLVCLPVAALQTVWSWQMVARLDERDARRRRDHPVVR